MQGTQKQCLGLARHCLRKGFRGAVFHNAKRVWGGWPCRACDQNKGHKGDHHRAQGPCKAPKSHDWAWQGIFGERVLGGLCSTSLCAKCPPVCSQSQQLHTVIHTTIVMLIPLPYLRKFWLVFETNLALQPLGRFEGSHHQLTHHIHTHELLWV